MLVHRSPSLTAICNDIKKSGKKRILDLGPAEKGAFQIFSGLNCEIESENLTGMMREHLKLGHPLSQFNFESLLSDYQNNEKFDVILAWDICNYLDGGAIEKLYSYIGRSCKPDALIYLLRYVESKIPIYPREIVVKDKYLLEMSNEKVTDRETDKRSTLNILNSMPGYFMQETKMGQMGMLPGLAEHVISYSPPGKSKSHSTKSEVSPKHLKKFTSKYTEVKKHYSPSLVEVVSLLQSSNDLSVLDLGAASNRVDDLLVNSSGLYHRLDLYSLIERSNASGTDKLNMNALIHKFACKFDVILTWDLFNFCSNTQLRKLNELLAQVSHENTFLLSHMYSSRMHYAKPSKFEVDEDCFLRISSVEERISSPQLHTGAALLKLLDAFNMDKIYAYRSGMDREIIEYIFAYDELYQARLGVKQVI